MPHFRRDFEEVLVRRFGKRTARSCGQCERPTSKSQPILALWAVDAKSGANIIPPLPAGSWPNLVSGANIVPVVANGLVFVASNRELRIFGPGAPPSASPAVIAFGWWRRGLRQALRPFSTGQSWRLTTRRFRCEPEPEWSAWTSLQRSEPIRRSHWLRARLSRSTENTRAMAPLKRILSITRRTRLRSGTRTNDDRDALVAWTSDRSLLPGCESNQDSILLEQCFDWPTVHFDNLFEDQFIPLFTCLFLLIVIFSLRTGCACAPKMQVCAVREPIYLSNDPTARTTTAEEYPTSLRRDANILMRLLRLRDQRIA